MISPRIPPEETIGSTGMPAENYPDILYVTPHGILPWTFRKILPGIYPRVSPRVSSTFFLGILLRTSTGSPAEVPFV